MATIRKKGLWPAAALLLGSSACLAQTAPADDLLDRAQQAVVGYINELAQVHCTEDVEQVKLRPNGKADADVRTQYDYFVLLQGNSVDFQLAESRLAVKNAPQRQPSLLLSNGFSMLLLIFHPYYAGGFAFTPEGGEDVGGRQAVRFRFSHIVGTRTPTALALRSREYPLDLQGMAWIDAKTGQPLRIDAELLHPMTDIGLQSLTIHVEYSPAPGLAGNPVLASVAEVDLQTPRQHWRNSHAFRDYKQFSTEATQDPNVKVHANTDETQSGPARSPTKEKP